MACAACSERRQIIAQAIKKDGTKGAVKVIPSVLAHIIRHPR